MKVYLDNCSLQRPLDDKSQVRIVLEAEAILSILTLSQQGIVELMHSDALAFEINQTPHPQRKAFAEGIVQAANTYIPFTPDIITRAKTLEKSGLKPLDALHIASAESAAVDYFCTCDDRLLKRLKTISDLKIVVMSPLEMIQELIP